MALSPTVRPGTRGGSKTRNLPPYYVMLLKDDDHSVPYVVKMLGELFGHPLARGMEISREVHFRGRAIVATTNLEQVELKRERVHGYGSDSLIERCKGSMSVTVEPASE